MSFKSTSFMWSEPREETSLRVLLLFIILTRLPDIPRIIGWPTADPKSEDEIPNKPLSDSPKLRVESKRTLFPDII